MAQVLKHYSLASARPEFNLIATFSLPSKKKMAICTLKREASGDTNMANSLILDFPPPEM
jgi:hypothetical protein